MSEGEAEYPPRVRQQVDAGGNAYVAGRDIVHQYPNWSSEDTVLEVLSANGGAKRLAELSEADETLERAGRLLTGVPPTVAIPALKVLLGRDEDLVIALLASINEVRTEILVSAMGSEGARLQKLPEATEAITQCEIAAGRVLGMRTGRFMGAASTRGTEGFLQAYANGAIHWSPRYGAHATTGAIARYHQDAGGSGGLLGFPAAAVVQQEDPYTGTECSWQLFEGPSDYSAEVCAFVGERCGGTVISSQKHGTHATWGGIGELSELSWRDLDSLGLPVADAVRVGPFRRLGGTTSISGWRQLFESGTVYCSDKTGAIRVPRRWAEYLKSRGDVTGPVGFPVSPVLEAAKSPFGTTGQFQRFEGLWDYPEDIVGRWSDRERPGGATIYHSPEHGTHIVEQRNGVLYERLNGTASWLGFPNSDESDVGTPADDPRRTIQRFEGGAIFCTLEHSSVPVELKILDYLAEQLSSENRLGFPIRGAEPLASGKDDYIQFFEQGVVTVRDNLIQAWFDPAVISGA